MRNLDEGEGHVHGSGPGDRDVHGCDHGLRADGSDRESASVNDCGSWLTLEKPGVEAVMRALEKIQERRGLSGAFDRQFGSGKQELFRQRGEPPLQILAIERAHDIQADRAADIAAQLIKKEQAECGETFECQFAEDRSEDDGTVAREILFLHSIAEFRENFPRKGSLRGGQEGAALSAAGAIGDMVGGESVELPIERFE